MIRHSCLMDVQKRAVPWICGLVSAALGATAQIAYQPSGPAYTQSFDGLSAVEGSTNPWTDNVSLPGWYATTASYKVNPGNTTDWASYGATGATDRALGSAGNALYRWALRLSNSASWTVREFTVAYVGEEWYRKGIAKTQTVDYALFAANAGSVSAAGYTDIPALAFTCPALGAAAAINGNDPTNRALRTATINGIAWLPGTELWIRWTSPALANSASVASDDVVFSSASRAPAGTMVLLR